MTTLVGMFIGFLAWFFVRYVLFSLYTVDQNQRAVKTSFGRAQRIEGLTTLDDPISETLKDDERDRYSFPQVRVIPPGGPYIKLPWEKVYKVSVATETVSMAWDPEDPTVNQGGTVLEAVTKDQLNTGLRGQIRFRVSEKNMYAYLFGVKNPVVHVMGYFISLLRERIANFEGPPSSTGAIGISINDLRKNLRDLNEAMESECKSSEARYGVILEASLITEIDPPSDVESALAAINTAHNHVHSEISLAQAAADQKIVQSKRAVEIETLKADAEVEPLLAMARRLSELRASGASALDAYLRNMRLSLFDRARSIVKEVRE